MPIRDDSGHGRVRCAYAVDFMAGTFTGPFRDWRLCCTNKPWSAGLAVFGVEKLNQALQYGDAAGRLDVLAVRLLESFIKARCGAPAESRLSVDLLKVGEMACERIGYRHFAALRPRLEDLAKQFGVETDQTLPELARSVGLLRGRRAGVKRGHRCTR